MTFLNIIESVIGNQIFVLTAMLVSLLVKLLVVIFTINQQANTKKSQHFRFLLLAILGANIFSDISWIQYLLQNISILDIDQRIYKFIGRIGFGLVGMQYQCLTLFLEKLITPQYKLTMRQKICCLISALFMFFSIGAAFICFNHPEPLLLLFIINRIGLVYYISFLSPLTLFIVLHKLHSKSLPGILTKQLYIILYCLIIPHLVSDAIQVFPSYFKLETNSYPITGLSALFLTIALLYCSRKVMGLRFLNLRPQVHALPKLDFVLKFTAILKQFSNVVSNRELQFIAQNFFEESLAIPSQKTKLYLRHLDSPYLDSNQYFNTNKEVEKYIENSELVIKDAIKKMEVLIYDEINFSNFYEQTAQHENLLQFLTTIKADIFVPIYGKDRSKNELIAYIIIERSARKKELYNSAERQEIVMFASYLHTTINILYNQNTKAFIEEFKQKQEGLGKKLEQEIETLNKEIYFRHQEINQYRECFQSLVYNSPRPIGIITYKNNRFTFVNQEAKNFIPIDINRYVGHPLVQKIKRVTDQVANFRSPQTIFEKDDRDDAITLHLLPHLEPGSVIIIISHADIPNLIKEKISFLKDPNKWDYLLYLETTKTGRLISQLIPGNSKTLFNFKIELLKAALGKKATLLDVAQEDLLPTVDLLHQISLREKLQILNLKGKTNTTQMATKLFGIKPLLRGDKDEPPLLEQLDPQGTLFIKDIHLLDLPCQEYLAEFIHYGLYQVYKSDQRKQSDVRIICSSNQNIAALVKENKFSRSLFAELKKATLCMPTLSSLPRSELDMLADSFSQQALPDNTFNNLLALTNKDKQQLAKEQPASLQELKNRVNRLIMKKADKNNIRQETTIDPSFETNDPILIHAIQLGKHALKDKKIMTLLWKKFNKNQNKIAELLGVNRSSVHRRCKLYNLM